MHDLNKNQLVLLCLLVSFVTSIATGIMTVSLLQQAPVEVTRTINSVVEKTIETVSPVKDVLPALSVQPPQKEVTTVVVKEEEAIIGTISKNAKSVVRISGKDAVTGVSTSYGIGFVADKSGSIVAPRLPISSGNVYSATMSDGTVLAVGIIGYDKKLNLIIFKPNQTNSQTVGKTDSKTSYEFTPVVLAQNDPQLGQSVVALGGDSSNAVAVGRVTYLNMKENGEGTSTTSYLSSVRSDVSSGDLVAGSLYFNLSGDLVGQKVSEGSSTYFIPASILKQEINSLSAAAE